MYKGKCDICSGCGRCGKIIKDNVSIIAECLPYSTEGKYDSYLICIDLGTTTLVAALYDEDGEKIDEITMLNPQRAYGADVVSRLSAAADKAILGQLRKLIWNALENMILILKEEVEYGHTLRGCIAGNTVMTALLLGLDTEGLSKAPFYVKDKGPFKVIIADTECEAVNSLAPFVGGDITAGIMAMGITDSKEYSMLIDLGTNAEIVLGNCKNLFVTSAACGPAFEGTMEDGGFGADLIMGVSKLLDEGIVDKTGLICDEYFDKGVKTMGVRITQNNIRALQLAKAAVRTGIDVLLDKAHIEADAVKNIYISGGFGYYLDILSAVNIGLIPKQFEDKTHTAGNTALAGCHAFATGGKEVNDRLYTVNTINLALDSDFSDIFLKNLEF